ncbi:hypothetical protein SDRG_04682 [Saprolegnia diclina VS20]|uniref:Uncharacterized protein n=1 Tax=Saprolegnia diclina (strain VS20) TaxID=1156394 RepID=T0QU65_SAPDV|nr:hypothetical protein SDRG_04682 [Saprolegnia diclina VS20]EQC38256.1 hypothetical protein SDRG_04682 [Saprolegnia diclina VS20]|eukprot:XP_008608583.1 hypothetical protein SDRG_04682 [Saprolegnia diclina VS20]
MASTQAAKRKADAMLMKATTADRDMDRLHQRDVTLCNEFGWTKLTTTGAFCTICSRIVVPRGSGFREYFYHEETAMHKKNVTATSDLSRAIEDEHSTSTRRSSRLKDKPLMPPMIDMDSSADEAAAPKTRRSTSASTTTTTTTATMAKAHSKPELMVYDDSSDDSDSGPVSANTAKVLQTPPLAPRATTNESPSQLRLLTLKKQASSSATKALKKTPTKMMFKPTPTKSFKPTPTKSTKPTKSSSTHVNHVEEDGRPSSSKKALRDKKVGPKQPSTKLVKPPKATPASDDSSEADEPMMEQDHHVNHVEEDVQSAPEEARALATNAGLNSPAATVTASEGYPEPDDVAAPSSPSAMTIPCTEPQHTEDDAEEVNSTKSIARPKKIRKVHNGLRSPPLTMLQYDTPATTSEDTSGDDDALEVAPMPSPTPTEMAMPPPPSACLTCMARCDADESVQRVLSALHKQTSALQEQLDSIRMLLQLAMSQHNVSHHV